MGMPDESVTLPETVAVYAVISFKAADGVKTAVLPCQVIRPVTIIPASSRTVNVLPLTDVWFMASEKVTDMADPTATFACSLDGFVARTYGGDPIVVNDHA